MRSESLAVLITSLLGLAFWAAIIYVVWRFARFRFSGRGAGPRALLSLQDDELRSLVTPRMASNSLTVASAVRDKVSERFLAACRAASAEVIAYTSPALSPPPWAHFEFILPSQDRHLSLRASCRITVESLDFHRFEHLLTVELSEAKRRRLYTGVTDLDDSHHEAIIAYLTEQDSVSAPKLPVVRQFPLQFWRPKNRIERLHPDWAELGFGALAFVLFFFGASFAPLVGQFVAIGIVFLLWVRRRARKDYVLTPGKPLQDPRLLRRFDSWQANIYGLGARAEEFRAELLRRLTARAGTEPQFTVAPERIWYAGVDGKVEREQIVVGYRRALAFVHVEAHGDDLFVGWDSHVNTGTWVERTLASGIDRESGKYVVAKQVVLGTLTPNEYDVTDTSFVTEWLHTVVTTLVRLKMEEHRIDQEIDFVIQRGSRDHVLHGILAREGATRARHGTGAQSRRIA